MIVTVSLQNVFCFFAKKKVRKFIKREVDNRAILWSTNNIIISRVCNERNKRQDKEIRSIESTFVYVRISCWWWFSLTKATFIRLSDASESLYGIEKGRDFRKKIARKRQRNLKFSKSYQLKFISRRSTRLRGMYIFV